MIKFKAKQAKQRGFALMIPGNGGDCELAIFTSWGRDNKTRLVIVAAEADGAVTVLHTGAARVTVGQIITTASNVMREWSRRGTKPTAEQEVWIEKQIDKICLKLDPTRREEKREAA